MKQTTFLMTSIKLINWQGSSIGEKLEQVFGYQKRRKGKAKTTFHKKDRRTLTYWLFLVLFSTVVCHNNSIGLKVLMESFYKFTYCLNNLQHHAFDKVTVVIGVSRKIYLHQLPILASLKDSTQYINWSSLCR